MQEHHLAFFLEIKEDHQHFFIYKFDVRLIDCSSECPRSRRPNLDALPIPRHHQRLIRDKAGVAQMNCPLAAQPPTPYYPFQSPTIFSPRHRI
jgi:hypothetical protein